MLPALPRLLIVEDDPDLADLLTTYFRSQRFEAERAIWGGEALQKAAEADFDLVLLDIRLPDISGYDVCRELRQNRRTQATPIIFLTEKRDRSDRLHGLELGVVDYITKPFDIHELRLRVQNAIRQAGLHGQLDPVTGLPGPELLDARLDGMLASQPDWALLLVRLNGLDARRDQAGFLAADDTLRAVALVMQNAVRELGSADDLIAHPEPDALLLISTVERMRALAERITARVAATLTLFERPLEPDDGASPLLTFDTVALDCTDGRDTVDAVRAALGLHVEPLPPEPL